MALSYSDLFDFDGYNKAIKDLDNAQKSFAKNTIDLNKQIAQSYKEIRAELEGYGAFLGKFSINTKGAGQELAKVSVESQKLGERLKNQRDAMQALLTVQDLTAESTDELKLALKEVVSQYSSLKGATDDVKSKKVALGNEYRRLAAAIKFQTDVLKGSSKEVKYAADSYKGMQAELTEVGNSLKLMSGAFDPVTGKLNQNNAQAVALQKRYIELNDILKNIDGGLGNFQRNVGNYGGALSTSVSQIVRELPAFSNSLQTGFLGISNNIGPLKDEIEKLVKANKLNRATALAAAEAQGLQAETAALAAGATRAEASALNAQTKAAVLAAAATKEVSVANTLLKSVFSLNTALTLGITLLTVYGKEIGKFISKLFAAKEQFDAATKSAEFMNEAFKDNSVVDAVKQISELQSFVNLAKEGFIEKDKVLKLYNDTLGKTAGSAKNLGDIEKFLADQADAYIQFTLLKAAANLALEEAAKKTLEIEKKRAELPAAPKNDVGAISGQLTVTGVTITPVGEALENRRKLLVNAAEKQLKEEQKTADGLIKIGDDLFKRAAEIAKKNKLKFLPDEKESNAEANKALNDYEKALRERQRIIKEDFETANKLAEDSREQNLISELELAEEKVRISVLFAEKSIKEETAINKVGYKAKESLLRDFNNTVIEANKNLSAVQRKLTEEELRVEQKRIEERAVELTQDLRNARDFILANQRLTNVEREQLELDFQKRLDDIVINSLEQRAAIEVNLVRKAELEKQAAALRARSARTQDFGTSILLPRAQGADEIRALENSLQRRRILGTLTVESEIQTTKEIIAIKKKRNEDTAGLEMDLFELEQRVIQDTVDLIKANSEIVGGIIGQDFADLFDSLIDDFQRLANGGKLAFEDIAQTAALTANVITANFKAGIDQQLSDLQKQKEEELKLVGNNASAQDAINKKFAREEALLKRKQAKADRDNAVFQVLINTSQAVQKAVAASPLTFGLPWSAAAAAIGALQVALILSRPLPQFAKGTEHSPEGLAVVGEQGSEMVIDPSGRLRIVGEKGAEVTYLQKGSKVKTASETKRILNDIEFENIRKEISLQERLSGKLKEGKQAEMILAMAMGNRISESAITNAIKKGFGEITLAQTIIDEKGQRERIKKGNSMNTYLNQFKLGR